MNPIRREKHYELVLRRIGQLIEERNLQVGQKLPPERELASTLRVSRSSVREACSILELQGIVSNRPGEGKVLLSRSLEGIYQFLAEKDSGVPHTFDIFFEVRLALEVAAAGLAAQRATAADYARMGGALSYMQERIDSFRDYEQADLRFHEAIVAAAHNPVLSRVTAFVAGPCHERMRIEGLYVGYDDAERKAVLRQHQDVYVLLVARDRNGAEQGMRQHLEFVRRMVDRGRPGAASPDGDQGEVRG